jgi:hypothetical protein
MDRRNALNFLAVWTVASCAFPHAHAECADRDHTLWVEKVLKRMQSIQPGMTRKQLETVFLPEGGLSEVDKRTYRSQDCLYFAVDVHFRLGKDFPDSQDQILSISPPYLSLHFVEN